jgi:hypothetical protein
MSLLLYLAGGQELRLNADPSTLASAFHNALAKGEAIQIDDPSDGGKFGINPRAILYWKADADPGPEIQTPPR